MIQKILLFIIIIAVIVAVMLGISRLLPYQTIPLLSGEKSPLRQIACAYPVKVAGKSMEPAIKEGSTLAFNKCIKDKKDRLKPETIILYNKFGKAAIGRIKPRFKEPKNVYYNVVKDAQPREVDHVFPKDIIGIYEE